MSGNSDVVKLDFSSFCHLSVGQVLRLEMTYQTRVFNVFSLSRPNC